MALTSKIFLDDRYTKNDGTQAIKIRLTINRKSLEIPTGYTIQPSAWNEKKSEIKTSCKTVQNVTRLNNIIKKQRIKAEDKIIRLQDAKELTSMTMKQIKDFIMDKREEKYIIQLTEGVIDQLVQAGRIGNANVYKTLRNSIRTFLNDKDVPVRTITYGWLKKYEAWYLGKGNSINGLSVHMRTLRAVINRAIKENIISNDDYPFANYSVKQEKTKKRAISQNDLEKIKSYLPTTRQQTRAKDYFLMSFYLMGASFIDLAFLRLKDIQQGRIEYRRKKTGQLHTIKITQPLQEILDRYTFGKSQNDFIINVITTLDATQQYIQARDELKRYNKRIKNIGELCGISIPLTSYVARHSFATIAKFKDVPTSVISQALGHNNAQTTEIYLAEFGDEIMDKYNEQIVG